MATSPVELPTQASIPDDPAVLRWMYRHLVLIRTFEERVVSLRQSGVLQGSTHLYVGQEAVAVGVCGRLERDDYVASTHRGHGHCIAKGVDVSRMMAELYGRATGTNRGKGGSMHIADTSVGMLGATGIVGSGTPVALGAALSAKLRRTQQVAVAFFGDGAMGQGIVYECLNMAAIWQLPLIFVCENNRYAESTPVEYALSTRDLATRAGPFNVPFAIIDGQDVFAVYAAADAAVERARHGGGPTFIECKTYRYYGHFFGDDPLRYRTREEEEHYRGRDCIRRFEQAVAGQGLLAQAELERIGAEVRETVEQAVRFAEASPLPDPGEVDTDVYTPQRLEV
ncbi:MAG: thiamine pyrophosphate-dependent dehydrogenase E1 component subunit alpha [Chloroflexi bacterium]|nr:thiamine pyrophosphate-dependent dehydrogenase E1 component subunit alpha [Chloroflexota bacterium]